MTDIVLFGITGDLAKQKLIPALARMHSQGFFHDSHFYGFGRKPFSIHDFQEYILKHSEGPAFAASWQYVQSELEDKAGYAALAEKLSPEALIYMSLPPRLHRVAIDGLLDAGVIGKESRRKLVLEKPFGWDASSAEELWNHLIERLDEEQIFLVDHYGAKESIMGMESGAALIPEHPSKIRVRLIESKTAAGRGALYDGIGALLDVGQNHILRMLTTALMSVRRSGQKDEDSPFSSKQRAKIVSDLVTKSAIFGRYEGFEREAGVDPDSATETYFKIEMESVDPFFKDICIVLEGGKATGADDSSVLFSMKDAELRVPVNGHGALDAYETVFKEAIKGEHGVFAGFEEICAAWKLVDSIKSDMEGKHRFAYPVGDTSAL